MLDFIIIVSCAYRLLFIFFVVFIYNIYSWYFYACIDLCAIYCISVYIMLKLSK